MNRLFTCFFNRSCMGKRTCSVLLILEYSKNYEILSNLFNLEKLFLYQLVFIMTDNTFYSIGRKKVFFHNILLGFLPHEIWSKLNDFNGKFFMMTGINTNKYFIIGQKLDKMNLRFYNLHVYFLSHVFKTYRVKGVKYWIFFSILLTRLV